MPSTHVSPSAITSNPLFNCPHALNTHFTKCHHLKPPFQLPPCPQYTFHPVPSPQTPFSTAPMPSIHISPSAITSNPLFNCPHALNTHFTQCHHLKPPFQLPPCPQHTFHPVPSPQTPFSTAPMPSIHISPSATTSNPLFNCPPCPQNTFHPVPPPPCPFSTAPMPSKHISPSATISNPLFNCPYSRKTHFTQCHHLRWAVKSRLYTWHQLSVANTVTNSLTTHGSRKCAIRCRPVVTTEQMENTHDPKRRPSQNDMRLALPSHAFQLSARTSYLPGKHSHF